MCGTESVKMLMQSGSLFLGQWGFWLQSTLIFFEEVSFCKWKISIEFFYFSYPLLCFLLLHISCYFFLWCSFLIQSIHLIFTLCCLCLSFPSLLSTPSLFSHFPFFPLISILPSSFSLPVCFSLS